MNAKEIKELFEKIKRHYNVFTYDDGKIQEWHRFLKDYRKEDILENFDRYLLEQHEQPPMVVSLNRGLHKEEQEEQLHYIQCDLCGEKILVGNSNWEDFEKHHRKCEKIDFIDRQCKAIHGKGITKETYRAMSDEELEKNYRQYMNNWVKTHQDIAMQPEKVFKTI